MDYWPNAIFLDIAMAGTRVPAWEMMLGEYRGQVKRALDVGAYEGQSAIFWHRFFGAEVDCIDNWENAYQPPTEWGQQAAAAAEVRFDHNTAGLSIRKLKGHSTLMLFGLP